MKILIICENYLPHYGGVEVLFKNLAEGFHRKGHAVSILTHRMKGTPKKENLNSADIHRVASLGSRYVFTFSSLFQAIKLARKHDIIQTTTFNSAFPAWVAAKITRKPVVLTVHEVWAGKWKEVTGFSGLKCALHELLERMIYLLPFDKYICVSNATKKDLLKQGIKEEKIEMIYNGVDYHFWNPNTVQQKQTEEIRKKLDIQDKFVFFSWGRPGASKGFEYVIEAAPQVAEKVPNSIFLLMLGSAERYRKKHQELMSLIKERDKQGLIKVISSVPYEELRILLKAVDCAVIPSVSEGFGYSTAEAVAMGKPVVISDAGALPEVAAGKHLIFSQKKVEDLTEKLIKMAQGTFQETEKKKFEWKETITKYLRTYDLLADNSSKRFR